MTAGTSLDPTGANSAVGQNGPVWFLAGSSTGGVVDRHVTLHLTVVSPAEVVPPRSRPYGETYSPLFQFEAPNQNILTGGAAAQGQSVSGGTYIMVPPLCEGDHTIRFGGSLAHPTAGGFSTDQTYHIHVVRPARVLPPEAKVAGKGLSDYAGLWWKWGIEVDAARVPISDPTGALGADRQSGPVWFLAGNFGGTTERSLTVPRGKHLFFPILNNSPWIQIPGVDPDPSPECVAANYECIRSQIRTVPNLPTMECEIDGRPVADLMDYYEESTPFIFGADRMLPGSVWM